MLTVHDGDAAVGALLRTADRPALVSAVPPRCAVAVVDALVRLDVDPGGAQGPVDEVEAFATAWSARTGATVEVAMRMRLFALDELCPPAGVPGVARVVAPDEEAAIDVLAAWRDGIRRRAGPHMAAPAHVAATTSVRALASGAGELLWEVDGEPVAQAAARPGHRGHVADRAGLHPARAPQPRLRRRRRPRRPRAGRSTAAPGTCCSTPTWRTPRRTGSTPAWASGPATTRSSCASCAG